RSGTLMAPRCRWASPALRKVVMALNSVVFPDSGDPTRPAFMSAPRRLVGNPTLRALRRARGSPALAADGAASAPAEARRLQAPVLGQQLAGRRDGRCRCER